MDTILDPALLAAEASAPAEPAALVTACTTDGKICRFVAHETGALTLTVEGRSNPLHFDRYQSLAIGEALSDHVGAL